MKKPAQFLFLAIILLSSCINKEAGTQTGFIRAGHHNVYYESTGKGESVFLLHAGLLDHTMWTEQVKALSKHYRVITIDQPYHGKTTGTDTTLLVQDLIKIVLDSLNIQKTSLVGLSMGASSAQDFMIAYPGRVNKVVLISSGINGYEKDHPMDSVSMYWYPLFKQALKDGDTVAAAKEFTKAWAEGIYRKTDSLKLPVSKFVYKLSLGNLHTHKMEGWPILNENPTAMEKLSSVHVPVFVIDGDKDLPYILNCSAHLKKSIPGAQHKTIKDVAHMLNLEKPEELNRLLSDFLGEKK